MTLPAQLPPLGLDGIVLKSGAHDSRESGVCALEAVAWFAGLPHSDRTCRRVSVRCCARL
jgi:hypothetical protein